jgi:chromosome segregation ATPase
MKVQTLEDKLRKTEDLSELHQSQYLAFAQRAQDLEERLDSMMKTLMKKDEEISTMKVSHRQEMEQFNNSMHEKDKVEKTLRKSINEVCVLCAVRVCV